MKKIIPVFIAITIAAFGLAQTKIDIAPKTTILNPDSLYCQEEVCAIETNQGELLVAWIDRKKGTAEKTVSYMVSANNKTLWLPIQNHDNKDFIWTGNPAEAKDDAGNLYRVDMSTNYGEGGFANRGVFELSVSKDGGKNWSEWKTIVKNSSVGKGWPDKPALIAKGNGELFMSYISFDMDSTRIFNSYGKVVFQKSKDFGVSWTAPLEIKSNRKWKPTPIIALIMGGAADLGEQGTSLAYYDNKIYISWGAYCEKGIYFTHSENDGESFETVKKISSSKVAVPVTQLLMSKNEWAVLYHNAHELGGVYIVKSINSGKSWKTIKVSENASLISGAIDNTGNLHVLWNNKSGNIAKTSYTIYSDKANYAPFELTKNGETPSSFFIGAYQHFLIDSNQNKHAFWIDWQQNGGKLKYSVWK